MKVVLAHGVFDLLHVGHVVHLTQARTFGDYLIVSVVPDRYITKRTPIYNQQARVRLLKELRCVDEVLLCNAPGPEKLIRTLQPDVYVRGADYRGKRMPEENLLEEFGIPVRYTSPTPAIPRTSEIIARIRQTAK